MNNYSRIYKYWCESIKSEQDLIKELKDIENNENDVKERFALNLEFGTAGLRGVLGAGTNRMNIYVVRGATEALARHLISKYPNQSINVSVSYDSRIKSDVFAKECARVFAANNIHVHIVKELTPAPLCSRATRYFKSQGGVMITASHNPKEYNGYKVYDETGCQVNEEDASSIYKHMLSLDYFKDVKIIDFEEGVKKGLISYIDDDFFEDYYAYILGLRVSSFEGEKKLKIAYTPLHGSGLKPVTETLKRAGYANVFVNKEQKIPDGNFPTCPYPNPETKEAMELVKKQMLEQNCDIAIATDPDADRVAMLVNDNGECRYITGNEAGILLLDYIANAKKEKGTLLNNSVIVKSIVSTDLVHPIAKKYGIEVKDVLTGFKFIGDVIKILEVENEEARFLLGFEESIGYLTGTGVRDKDSVNASLMIAEMSEYYLRQGKNVYQRLQEIYEEFGYALSCTNSFTFPGLDGLDKMKNIMAIYRNEFATKLENLECIYDYQSQTISCGEESKPLIGLPKANVISYKFKNGVKVTVRPSGTEPKIKIYYYLVDKDKNNLENLKTKYIEMFEKILK